MNSTNTDVKSWFWPPGRNDALQRLERFAKTEAQQYASQRNLDRGFGNHSGVSRLSPWIRHRGLLETEVITQVINQKSAGNTHKRGYNV